MKHLEKKDVLSSVTLRHGKKRDGTKKTTNRGKNNPYLLQQTVDGVRILPFDAKVLIFSLFFTQFQIVSAEKTFLAQKLKIFCSKFSTMCFFGERGSAKTRKGTNKYKITDVKSRKTKFQKTSA